MTTQRTSPEGQQAEMPWPLRFDSFSFGTRAFNTLRCNIIFRGHQFALDDELDQPTGQPPSPNWKDSWTASFLVADYMMPGGPVEVRWTSLDGEGHYVEINIIEDIFPGQVALHKVPKDDVNQDWVRYEGGRISPPDILMEINDRTINVYMSAHVLTKSFPIPGREDVKSRWDLVLAWTKTY